MRQLKRTTTPKNYAHMLKHSFLMGAWRALRRDPEEYQRWHQLTVIRYMMCQMTRTAWEIDHLESFEHGGTNHSSNLVVTTKEWNRRKGKKQLHPRIVEWFKGEEL